MMREKLADHVCTNFEDLGVLTARPSRHLTAEPEPYDLTTYRQEMYTDGVYGGTAEIQAFCDLYQKVVVVICDRRVKFIREPDPKFLKGSAAGAIEKVFVQFSGLIGMGHFDPLVKPPLPEYLKPKPVPRITGVSKIDRTKLSLQVDMIGLAIPYICNILVIVTNGCTFVFLF